MLSHPVRDAAKADITSNIGRRMVWAARVRMFVTYMHRCAYPCYLLTTTTDR